MYIVSSHWDNENRIESFDSLSIANKVVWKYRSDEVCTYAETFLAVELDVALAKSNCAYCNSSKII